MAKSSVLKRGVNPAVSVLFFIFFIAAVFSALAGTAEGPGEGTEDGGIKASGTVKSGDRTSVCGLAKKGANPKQAVSALENAGVKNIKVHTRAGVGTAVTGDAMPCMFVFGTTGFDTEVRFDDALARSARPEKYAVAVLKNRHVFVTAEDFNFILPDGEPAPGVFMIWREGGRLNTYRIDVSNVAELNGGFIEPALIEKADLNQVILHAKDSDGNDWPQAYVLDGTTGKPKGEVEWEKVKAGRE